MSYRHIQRGRIHYLLLIVAAAILTGGIAAIPDPAAPILLVAGAIFFLMTFLFAHLLIEDRGDHLHVTFGPVSAFRTKVPYSSILSVERGRSSFIDGIGIHWLPGRGWIWNIATGDCVILTLERGILRLGSDDAAALCEFLERRIGNRAG